jgi:hypothetical protein
VAVCAIGSLHTAAADAATTPAITVKTAQLPTAVMITAADAGPKAGTPHQPTRKDVRGRELVRPVDHARSQDRPRGTGGGNRGRRDDGHRERAGVVALMQEHRGREHARALRRQAPPEHLAGTMAMDQAADGECEHGCRYELRNRDGGGFADATRRIGVGRERDPHAELGEAEPGRREAQAPQ